MSVSSLASWENKPVKNVLKILSCYYMLTHSPEGRKKKKEEISS